VVGEIKEVILHGHRARSCCSYCLAVRSRAGTWRRTLSSVRNALTVFMKSAG
jgi:hypothetical protein